MAAPKGHPKYGGGRKKGTPNKITRTLKDMILQALADEGGVDYLRKQAARHPNAFMALLGRVLPLNVKEGGSEPVVPGVTITGYPDVEALRRAKGE
jgi:hypothetical protein